jgi:hypothetical protein
VGYMLESSNGKPLAGLTATEVSNIWSSYLKSSLETRFLEYFSATTEDPEIKIVVEKILDLAQNSLSDLREIFTRENLKIPVGFTENDVNIGAQKVFSDTFILYFCHDITFLSMITYPSALSDTTRKDVRNFFQKNIESSVKTQNEIVDVLMAKGVYLSPPQIEIDDEVDFVDAFKYLSGFFGGSRPVNTAEIANLTRIVHRAQFSKMIFVAFHDMARNKDVKKFFSSGRDEIEKVIDSLTEVLEEENIPISSSGDYKIVDTEFPPFSDRLMLYFVNACLGMFCFNMVNQAMTTSLRSDIIFKLNKISKDMKKYYAEGLLITIKEKWFEQPPQAVDRRV